MAKDPAELSDLEARAIEALRTCFDPELPVNIYDLGLVYDVAVDERHAVAIRMTLTAPGCPVAGSLPEEVRRKVLAVPGVTDAKVDLVFDPPWDPSRMSDEAKLALGWL